jgi:O-antigen ligase
VPDPRARRAAQARDRRRSGQKPDTSRGVGGPFNDGNAIWRRWTLGILIVTALGVPLIFDFLDRDAFARAKLALLHLLVPLAAAGPLLAVVTGRVPWRVRPQWPDVSAAIFAGLAVLATVFSIAPQLSLEGEHFQWQGLVSLLLYAVAYAVARNVLRDEPALRRFFGALALATLIVAAYGLLQQLRLDPVWGILNKGRIFSTLGQANNLAAFLVLTVPCVGALVVVGGRVLRAVAATTIVLAFAALALTLSRGGYLGLLAGLVAMAAASAPVLAPLVAPSARFDRRWLRAGLLLFAAAIAVVIALPPAREQAIRVMERGSTLLTGRDSSTETHLDLWAVGLRITLDHPLLGTGPDTYATDFPRYRNAVLAPERAAVLEKFRPESPHNVYLAISSGLGIPALAAYLAVIAGALIRAARSARSSSGPLRVAAVALIGAIVGHLVSDAFMTAELTGSWLFWTSLGAAVSLPEPATVRAGQDPGDRDRNREGSGRTRTPRQT